MSSDDEEHPPKELLQPLTQSQPPQSTVTSSSMRTPDYSTVKKPYQITFSSRDEEIKYTEKLLDNCTLYNGHSDNLMSWLRDTGAFIVKERYPETDHPFIIRHLLTDDALDYYLAHEDMIFNFYDLRKLLLHKHNVLAPLRTLPTLDSIATLSFTAAPPVLTSTQKIVTVQHHHSHLLVTNSSDAPEHIPEFFCFGYLLSNPVGSQNFFNQIALLCRRYNEKKNQQTFNRTVTYSQLPQRLFNDSKRLYRSTPSINHVTLNTLPRFSSSQFQQTRDLLVNHLLDHDNKDRLLALLAQFSQLFDNSRHNISNIVVENVFNTVPHSPPSFRPHRNPHHREETQRLIDEFLEAGMIQESNSPYAAPAFIVPRKDNRPGRLVVDYRALNKGGGRIRSQIGPFYFSL
ncbi:unnamed protein product [Rotaria magnacalcarata]